MNGWNWESHSRSYKYCHFSLFYSDNNLQTQAGGKVALQKTLSLLIMCALICDVDFILGKWWERNWVQDLYDNLYSPLSVSSRFFFVCKSLWYEMKDGALCVLKRENKNLKSSAWRDSFLLETIQCGFCCSEPIFSCRQCIDFLVLLIKNKEVTNQGVCRGKKCAKQEQKEN